MFYGQEDYQEMKKLCAEATTREFEDVLREALKRLVKEYLYEVLRNYQRKEKELLLQKLRQGQKFSQLFQRTAESEENDAFFQMGQFAGIVKLMEYLYRDLVDRTDFASRISGLCQKAHYYNILRSLYEHPGERHKNLAGNEGISYSHLTEIMKELQEAHAVDKYYQGKAALYELTEEGREYIAETLKGNAEKISPDYLEKSLLLWPEKDGAYLEKVSISLGMSKKKESLPFKKAEMARCQKQIA